MNSNDIKRYYLDSSKIFCIDDDLTQLLIYKQFLKDTNFIVETAINTGEALKKISENIPDLILLDINMPDINGLQFLQYLKSQEKYKSISVMMISSQNDSATVASSFEAGAVDYLKKPFNKDEFIMRILVHLENEYLKRLNNDRLSSLEINLYEKTKQISDIKNATIFSLAKLTESRDPETGGHLERIREYSKSLSFELAEMNKFNNVIDNNFIQNIYNMSVLHDIGKVGIPDNILLKPAKLTNDEFEIMKTHTIIGGNALDETCHLNKNAAFLEMGRDIAYYHHERWDGNGYPKKLKGEEIPLAARITAVADMYDAISIRRVYRQKIFTDEEINDLMVKENGGLFDPEIFNVYLKLKDRFLKIKKYIGF